MNLAVKKGTTTTLRHHAAAKQLKHLHAVEDCSDNFKQPSITDAFASQLNPQSQSYPSNSLKKMKVDQALVEMLAKDMQPLGMVEDEGFRKFCRSLDNKYTPPS